MMFFENNFFFGLTINIIFLPLLVYGEFSLEEDMANNSYVPNINPRIANGTKSVAGQFPYVVSVRYVHGYHDIFYCGGTILNSLWVITAAHCLYYAHPSNSPLIGTLKIIAGENTLVTWWKARYKRSLKKYVVYPKYQPYKSLHHRDLALLMMDKPWIFSDYVRPIKIIDHSLPANTTCIVSGYGEDIDRKLKGDLSYSKEYLYGNYFCRTHIPRDITGYNFPDGTLCAGNLDEYTGPCWRDTGSPLVCDNRLVAISVAIYTCGRPGLPNVYVDVKYHRNWIQSKLIDKSLRFYAVKTSKTHTLHDSSNSFRIVNLMFILFILY